MTAGELVFLAFGLGIGIVSGAAMVEVLRTRPPVPRQVRVTIQADAIPRGRPSTLAEDAFAMPGAQTARGGPADRRADDIPMRDGSPERRTSVRSGPGTPVFAPLVGIPVAGGHDPLLAGLRDDRAGHEGHGIVATDGGGAG